MPLTASAGVALGSLLTVSCAANAKGNALSSSVDLSGLDKPTRQQGALTSLKPDSARRIHLINVHTGDNFDLVYFKNGEYVSDSIARLNHLMRDRRANVATNMDTTLYDQLYLLQTTLGLNRPIHVLSGYRTPETNARLRRRSKGVAKYSLHMEGRAADIYVPGMHVSKLQKAALGFAAGGVGLYSSSNFIHLDTGPVRNWGR
jgi:uncharacterized protein YcbK (DUF882 family)